MYVNNNIAIINLSASLDSLSGGFTSKELGATYEELMDLFEKDNKTVILRIKENGLASDYKNHHDYILQDVVFVYPKTQYGTTRFYFSGSVGNITLTYANKRFSIQKTAMTPPPVYDISLLRKDYVYNEDELDSSPEIVDILLNLKSIDFGNNCNGTLVRIESVSPDFNTRTIYSAVETRGNVYDEDFTIDCYSMFNHLEIVITTTAGKITRAEING